MFDHRPWEEELLEAGWESLGVRHVGFQGKWFRFEACATANFEETSVDLQVFFPDEICLESHQMEASEEALNLFLRDFFGSDEWDDNWEWFEDGTGLEAFDLGDGVEELSRLVSREEKLKGLLEPGS